MFERQFRAYSARLQKAYDWMPYPVQNVLTSTRGWFLTRIHHSRHMYGLLEELCSHDRWSADEITSFQLQTLQKTVEHARKTVPFYADYPPIRWNQPQDIAQYPVLTREIVRQQSERFISRDASTDCIRVATTGTTGASLKVAYNTMVACRNWAFRMRSRAWAGVEPRHPRVTLFGARIIPPGRTRPPYWTYNYPDRQILMSIFHMSESSAPHYISFLRRHRGKVLEGFPSVLGILADLILRAGEPVPVHVVFTDGEPLYPFLREMIEQAFQTRIFDLYGNTEACGLIHECESHQMHFIPDHAYLEILNENNRPAQVGEEGYLVWTGFENAAMPLIRYRIGDRGCWQIDQRCACGRAFPLVVPTITRDSDTLRCPDGRMFSPRALAQSLKEGTSLRFCQLVQENAGHVVVRAVATNGNSLEEIMAIRNNLQKVLGKQIVVSATIADAPIVRTGGKIPLIVQATRS